MSQSFARVSLALIVLLGAGQAPAADLPVVSLWPARAPGETKELPPEQNLFKEGDKLVGGKPIIKLTNVSTPTLTLYQPQRPNGCAVIVCPGGGHNILAFDHEGTEVAQWLNTLGVTAGVLKYRVPARNPERRWQAAVQDAQRAVSLVRSRASEWKLAPDRIGVLGFSAGGETAGLAAILHAQRTYPAVDAVDEVSCRPDFAALLYPGGLVARGETALRDYVQVDKTTPPMFFVHAYDDGVTPLNSLLLATELQKAGVSAELHLYATGGHGYGMRNTGHPVNGWPARCGEWLAKQGWLGGQ